MHRRLPIVILAALLLAGPGAGAGSAAGVVLVLEASTACCEAGAHQFGWLDGASAGLDPADVPEPPPPLGAHLRAGFRLPGVSDPDLWRSDLRATADFAADRRERWDLVLAPSALPATCTITVSAASGDAQALRLVVSGACADTLGVPATFSLPLGSETLLGIEILDEALAAPPLTWGAAKCLYR